MVIDNDSYDEGPDNRDNRDEQAESSTDATESNGSLYDSSEDNNTFEELQRGLYSSEESSDDDNINLIGGNILQYLFIYNLTIINNY